MLRREISHLQIAAAGAGAAADELASSRRQVRELTQALDQAKAQGLTLKSINEDLTKRNLRSAFSVLAILPQPSPGIQ